MTIASPESVRFDYRPAPRGMYDRAIDAWDERYRNENPGTTATPPKVTVEGDGKYRASDDLGVFHAHFFRSWARRIDAEALEALRRPPKFLTEHVRPSAIEAARRTLADLA